VHVQWLGQLILQKLSLLLLFQNFFLQKENFSFEVGDALSVHLRVVELALGLADDVHHLNDVVDLLLIIVLTLLQSRLLDLDLLVQKREFLISLNQLSAKDVSLIDHHLIVLLLLQLFALSFTNDILQPGNVIVLSFDHLFR